MKKIIIVILTSFLFASNTVVIKKKQKETNSTYVTEEVIIKKWLINKINAILPNYLQAEPKENMLNFSLGYDTKNKKYFSRLNIRLIFPSLETKYTKSTLKNTKSYTFKLLPIFQIYKHTPCPTLKASFTYNNQQLLKNLTFNETFYYYTVFTEYKEITTVTLKRFITIDNLMYKIAKTYYSTDKHNLYYYTGVYYYSDFIKFIRIYGYECGGERKKLPIIYWHRIFFTYRKILFNKRYIFLDITPYLFISKEYDYNPKIFFTTSINVKF
ncbi:hypothetical protein [Caminibacter sp.]